MRLFKSYLGFVGEFRNPENISSSDLGNHVARFFLNVKKADGNEYEYGFQASINRYLSDKKYAENILKGTSFKHSRDVLQAKCKNLKQNGKGNRPQEAEALTKEEIALLYNAGQLCTGMSPTPTPPPIVSRK